MKRNGMFWLSVAVAILGMADCSVSWGGETFGSGVLDANDPPPAVWNWSVWFMAGDGTGELRAGGVFGDVEAYIAPRYDTTRATEGDVLTDLRVYGLYNALDAEIAANLLGNRIELPEGNAYAGLFGGWEMEDGQTEAGWCVGARVRLRETDKTTLDSVTEYQRLFTTFREDSDRDMLFTGVALTFE